MTGKLATILSAAMALLIVVPAYGQPKAPKATIASGALQGVRDGDVVSFKGIPYAAPPVGVLRWKPPQPVKAWRGVRAADKMGAICQQVHNAKDDGVGPLPMSEDCLTLNVFAPANAKRAPVMFWIHGGGFVNGSGTAALYDGAELARQGVVVVTINYRLGRFGFFAHPALSAEAKGQPVGNYALMDMIAALKWVRQNIARFGGDPDQVTIFGESAGGVAVNDLMVSPAARGLFARAISQSGLGREAALPLGEAEKKGESFAAALGLGNASAADLRKLTPEQILKAGDPDIFGGGTSMIDGRILTVGPAEGFRKGVQAQVPYVVGWNSLEFPVPFSGDIPKRFAGNPALTAPALTAIAAAYPDKDGFAANFISDLVFVEPAVNLARLHADRGLPTYVYQFSVVPASMRAMFRGAPHATERKYVFRTLGTSAFPTDANDAAQAEAMSAYWTAFARSGDPNGGGRPVWPAFSSEAGEIIDFTNEGPKKTDVPRKAALDALSAAYP